MPWGAVALSLLARRRPLYSRLILGVFFPFRLYITNIPTFGPPLSALLLSPSYMYTNSNIFLLPVDFHPRPSLSFRLRVLLTYISSSVSLTHSHTLSFFLAPSRFLSPPLSVDSHSRPSIPFRSPCLTPLLFVINLALSFFQSTTASYIPNRYISSLQIAAVDSW